jgi:hypothetical protein
MTREEKVLIYVMGLLEDARASGLKGGRFRLAADGLDMYRQLKAEKFKPTQEEMEIAFVLIKSPPDEINQAYKQYGILKFEWASAHVWLWIMFKRRVCAFFGNSK